MGQRQIAAVYMRGGTSKGLFLNEQDLPKDEHTRDQLLLRLLGSPDPYRQQIDGMGGATSSTSKVVIVRVAQRDGVDVEYLFGQVSIADAFIDWSGNCGNLTAAVANYAISSGLLHVASDGLVRVRMWQRNVQKMIIAHVDMADGEVVESGDFWLDGVAFPAAEVRLEFIDPADDGGLLPTGNPLDLLPVPGEAPVAVSLLNAGNPTVFVAAASLGMTGRELPSDITERDDILRRAELLRAHGALAMGLIKNLAEAKTRQHTPKLLILAEPADYLSSAGRQIHGKNINLLTRIFSMGKLHHAMTGTGAVALAAAAEIPGTLVARFTRKTAAEVLHFGHPSGTTKVQAHTSVHNDQWRIDKVVMSRSARRIMAGHIYYPS